MSSAEGKQARYRELALMKKMEKALQYMLDHLQDGECDMERVAAVAEYEPAYFRRVFRDYFGMPFSRFLTRLKIWEAARIIQEENFPKNLGLRLGMSGAPSFARAFHREMGISAQEFYKGAYDVPDFPMRDSILGIPVRVDYRRVGAFRMIGKPLRPSMGNETDILEDIAYAYQPAALSEEERQGADHVGIWWYDAEERLYYCFGTVQEQYDRSIVPYPSDRTEYAEHVSLLVQGGNYALFSYPRPEKDEDIPRMSCIMGHFVFYEWVLLNHVLTDTMGFTYERFTTERVYLYLPIVFGTGGSEGLKRKQWDMPRWASMIDDHITEHLTIETLAEDVGYSPQNYREVFTMYYNISPMAYIRKRRLYMAESGVIQAHTETEKQEIMHIYGFSSMKQFGEQYLQVFGHPPFTVETEEVTLTDLLTYYAINKDSIRCTVRKVEQQEFLMHTIKTTHDDRMPKDIQGLVIFWCREEFDDFRQFESIISGRRGNRRKVFLWGKEPEYEEGYKVYRYRVGVALKKSFERDKWMERIDEVGATLETIPSGRYAVFSTREPEDTRMPGEAFNRLTRCAFGGWIGENRFRVDMQRRTFVIWKNNKFYFHVPVIR